MNIRIEDRASEHQFEIQAWNHTGVKTFIVDARNRTQAASRVKRFKHPEHSDGFQIHSVNMIG